jgi:hypothetical protein
MKGSGGAGEGGEGKEGGATVDVKRAQWLQLQVTSRPLRLCVSCARRTRMRMTTSRDVLQARVRGCAVGEFETLVAQGLQTLPGLTMLLCC